MYIRISVAVRLLLNVCPPSVLGAFYHYIILSTQYLSVSKLYLLNLTFSACTFSVLYFPWQLGVEVSTAFSFSNWTITARNTHLNSTFTITYATRRPPVRQTKTVICRAVPTRWLPPARGTRTESRLPVDFFRSMKPICAAP